MLDQLKFLDACRTVVHQDYTRNSIGLLQEKTLHAVLKYYFEPHSENQEVSVGGFIADIVGENGIIEIQTSGFEKLRRKLSCFLKVCPVTVVYPIPQIKWLCWIDPDTGLISKRRRSPKQATPFEAFWELSKIREFLLHPNLSVRLMMLEIEEYRYLNGWSSDRKRGSSRCDRIPLTLLDEIVLSSPSDYIRLLPESLPALFTLKDFSKAAGILPNRAQSTLSVLKELEVVRRCGNRGRAFLYEINR